MYDVSVVVYFGLVCLMMNVVMVLIIMLCNLLVAVGNCNCMGTFVYVGVNRGNGVDGYGVTVSMVIAVNKIGKITTIAS